MPASDVPAWAKASTKPTYTASEVGALASNETAAAATKLATARTIQTNLGSTSSASFDGTANITPGVTGTLPVANGGTGATSLDSFASIILPYVTGSLAWSEWGSQTASGAGNATWWANLKNWLATSNEMERKMCVGLTKSVTLSSAVLGTTTHLVRCIGADQDGARTLTFQTANCLATTTTFGSNAVWIGSTARTQCQNYYNAFPGKNYIKSINKGTCANQDSSRNASVTYNTETVWLPSEREMGLDTYSTLSVANSTTSKAECTQGYNAPYSYYNSNERRKKTLGDSGNSVWYWERSRHYDSSTSVCDVNSSGRADFYGYDNSGGLAPAYVIG